MTTSLLERSGVPLARMPLLSTEPFAFHCAFQPTPAFAPSRPLFDEEARLTDRLAHDAGPAQAVLLGTLGGSATFRPLHPQAPSPEEEAP